MLVREGSLIPHMKVAQSTAQMDWSNLDMVVFASSTASAQGLVCLPKDNILHPLRAERRNGAFVLAADPLAGQAVSRIHAYTQYTW
jgi:alpha-D-xyloside xylohydrolase